MGICPLPPPHSISTIATMPRAFAQSRALLVLFVVLLVGCQFCSPPAPVVQPADAGLLEKSVYYLAGPELQGRGPGTAGLDYAAHYLAGYFRGLSLCPPPGYASHFQTFVRTYVVAPSPESFFKVDDLAVSAGEFIPLNASAEGVFDAPVVFVGYGLAQSPQGGSTTRPVSYDDYAGVDLTGKIALAMAMEPHDASGRPRLTFARSRDVGSKARLAAEHGAVALLVVHPPTHPTADRLAPFRRSLESAPASRPVKPEIPIIQISQGTADELLRRSGAKPLRAYAESINSSLSPRSFVLRGVHVEGRVAFARQTYNFHNIVAWLPGKGPRAKEYIVIGAHYDHVGVASSPAAPISPGGARGPRPIGATSQPTTVPTTRPYYPGADDNASGTAGLLELARLFAQTSRPARSILFVAFSAEEQGLLGSKHFVENPPVPLERIVAMINLDMLGRLRNDTIIVSGSGTASVFPGILEAANQSGPPFQIRYSWTNGLAPSDIASFAGKGIPSLFFITGSHPDLHRVTDTPDKINYAGQAKVVDFVANTVRSLTVEKQIMFSTSPPATRPAVRR